MSAIDVDEAAEGGANRVLIVDDDVDFAEGLELLLMGEGYEIEQAHSVVEARRRLEHFNADVALIDIRLGGGDGIGLIPQLKTPRPDLLCVMMTAFASTDSVILALQRGAYDYLRKPIQGSDLLATLGRCFDVRRLVSDKAQAEAALFTRNQELEQINARLRMVVGSMRLLTNWESLSELGRRILEEVARNMDADGGSVYLLE